MKAAPLLDDIAALKAIIADRDAVIADHEQLVAQLQEQVRQLKVLQYVAKSEKAKSHQGEEQYSLFDEAEFTVT